MSSSNSGERPNIAELQNPNEAIATQTEISPGKVLMGIETEQLHHETEIPKRLWEPLLGGEDLNAFWNEILIEPGDEVIIKGSTALMLVFGGYVLDTKTGLAAHNLRSDIDVEIYDPKVLARVQTRVQTNSNGHAKQYTQKIPVGDITIDIIDQEALRKKIHASAQHIMRQVAQINRPDLAQFFYYTQDKTQENADPREIMLQNSFFKQDSIGIVLKRNEKGELTAHINDMLGVLQETRILMPNIDTQKEMQETTEVFTGFLFRSQNTMGFPQSIMETARSVPEIRFKDEDIPYFTAQHIGRLVRADCELGITVWGDPVSLKTPQPYYTYYLDIVNLAGLLAHDQEIFIIEDEKGEKADRKTARLKERIITSTQKDIARAAFSDPIKALLYTFEYLPIGNFVSEEIAAEFRKMRSIFPYSNTLDENLESMQARSDKLPKEHNIKAMRTFLRIKELARVYYGEKHIALHIHQKKQQSTKKTEPIMYKYELARPPANMSEVMALLFVASKWEETETAKIEKVVENWRPKGKLGLTWKRQTDTEFEIGVNTKEIVAKMKEIKKFDINNTATE